MKIRTILDCRKGVIALSFDSVLENLAPLQEQGVTTGAEVWVTPVQMNHLLSDEASFRRAGAQPIPLAAEVSFDSGIGRVTVKRVTVSPDVL